MRFKFFLFDNELEPGATVKKYLIVQTEGGREVRREVEHYNLRAIISVGFKIENERAVQFLSSPVWPCNPEPLILILTVITSGFIATTFEPEFREIPF